MGLLDTIDRLNTADGQAESHRSNVQPLLKPAVGEVSVSEAHTSQNIWQADPAELDERRQLLKRKPEHLSFLGPCPVCGGRKFMHLEGVGFQCRTCHPWNVGCLVLATGPDDPVETVNTELLPAGESTEDSSNPQGRKNQPTEEQLASFLVAWAWIKENRAALLAAGWTMAVLVRRAKCRCPYGSWGLAWLAVWNKPDLAVTIGRCGEIMFCYQSNNRTIRQVAKP
nr:hypothetical protein [uncultured Desulfobulbus sp.]